MKFGTTAQGTLTTKVRYLWTVDRQLWTNRSFVSICNSESTDTMDGYMWTVVRRLWIFGLSTIYQ